MTEAELGNQSISLCHLFLDTQREHVNEIKKYLYSDDYDKLTIKKFINKIFVPSFDECKCSSSLSSSEIVDTNNPSLFTHQIAVNISDLVDYIDVKEENILTLLCYLQNANYIILMPNCYKYCSIKSYKGMSHLKQKSTSNEMLRKIFEQVKAEKSSTKHEEDGELKFDLIKLCSESNWEYSLVVKQLKALEWEFKETTTANSRGSYVKSGNKAEFHDLSFHIMHKCMGKEDVFYEKIDEMFELIWNRVSKQQTLGQLNFKSLYKILSENAFNTVDGLINDLEFNKKKLMLEKNEVIKSVVDSYFVENFNFEEFCASFKFDHELNVNPFMEDKQKDTLIKNIRKFINLFSSELKITGRLIAKVFHGVPSPRCPVEVWSRNRLFWRCNLDFDFDYIIQVATNELINK